MNISKHSVILHRIRYKKRLVKSQKEKAFGELLFLVSIIFGVDILLTKIDYKLLFIDVVVFISLLGVLLILDFKLNK